MIFKSINSTVQKHRYLLAQSNRRDGESQNAPLSSEFKMGSLCFVRNKTGKEKSEADKSDCCLPQTDRHITVVPTFLIRQFPQYVDDKNMIFK